MFAVTSIAGPDPYVDLVPEAVLKAQSLLFANPALVGEVDSWLTADDAAEATSRPRIAEIELHLPQNLIPPEMPVNLVEEMLEHLIEESMPARQSVDVKFHIVSTVLADARLANLIQPFDDYAFPDRELKLIAIGSVDHSLSASPTIAREGPTVPLEGTAVVHPAPVETDEGPMEPASNHKSSADPTSQPIVVADQQAMAVSVSNDRMVKQTDKPSPLLAQLRTDLRLVEESIVSLLNELQEFKNGLVDWFSESEIPLWVQVTFGSAAIVVISHELRERRKRHAQIDEGAFDWIFMLSVEPTSPD